jgi:DNA-binding LytR/AlgR family response regulator
MEQKINCIVVDDEPLAKEGVIDLINQFPILNLKGDFSSVKDALHFLTNNPTVQLIFSDINMPGINGLEFKQILNSRQNPVKLVFITAYREFALDGFDLNAIDYLLKPVSLKRFAETINKITAQLKPIDSNIITNVDESFFIKVDGKIIKINISEILFIEGLKDYLFVHTQNDKYLTLLSLKSIEDKLPKSNFLRVHRSFIVNTDKVDGLEGNQILIQKHVIPIGKTQKESVFELLIGNKLWKRG